MQLFTYNYKSHVNQNGLRPKVYGNFYMLEMVLQTKVLPNEF